MAEIYERWERLVRATLVREQLRLTALRTPSDLSLVSSSSSFDFFRFDFSSARVSLQTFDYAKILRATNYFNKNSNLIKRGRSGDLFYGFLEEDEDQINGIEIVVKRVDLLQKDSYLMRELEVYSKVWDHPRFVPLLGHCSENWDDKYGYLIYKHMHHKDLTASSFYGKSVWGWEEWEMRLKIAIGLAKALCHLHNQCIPPLVHGDVKAGSIFLDDNFEVRLGSLSSVRAHEGRLPPRKFEQDSSGFSDTTCWDDVFAFGKVLVELIVGDSRVRMWDENYYTSIVDSMIPIQMHIVVNEALSIAKACLEDNPFERPSITQIISTLRSLLVPGHPKPVHFWIVT